MSGAGPGEARAALRGARVDAAPRRRVAPAGGPPGGSSQAPPGALLPAPRVPFRRRTRLVAWAKVMLPLAALALLSTLFLLARAPDGSGMPGDVPFARIEEVAGGAGEGGPRIDAPRLAGLAPDGTAVILQARRLLPLPGQPDGFHAEAPRLETRAPPGVAGGLTARLAAAEGEVLGPTRTLRLLGGVALDATSPAAGPLRARMGSATADLGSGTLTGLGGVEAETRLGSLRADAMRLVQGGAEGTEAGARVVFNGAVRLVYHPLAAAPPAPAGAP